MVACLILHTVMAQTTLQCREASPHALPSACLRTRRIPLLMTPSCSLALLLTMLDSPQPILLGYHTLRARCLLVDHAPMGLKLSASFMATRQVSLTLVVEARQTTLSSCLAGACLTACFTGNPSTRGVQALATTDISMLLRA
jgi:hypothetical protein